MDTRTDKQMWKSSDVAHTSKMSGGPLRSAGAFLDTKRWDSNLPYLGILLINLLQGSLLALEDHSELI